MSSRDGVIKEATRLSPEAARGMMIKALAVGGLGLAASVGGYFAAGGKQFYFSWLVAFAYVCTISLGLLFFTLIQHVVAARWSVVVRRFAEAAAGNMWLLGLLFIPVLVGAHDLYHHWLEGTDELVLHKRPYLNMGFFVVRAALFIGAWALIGNHFFKKSVEQDEVGGVDITLRLRRIAGPCLFVFALTLTFSGIDWYMSIDPHWYSTMFGVYIFAGSALSAFCMLVVMTRRIQGAGYLSQSITREHYHDMGKLMFAFTVFWAYIGFCQYFLIWYANIPEETVWFLHRWEGAWRPVSLSLPLLHFAFPFMMLLSRHPKRNPMVLGLMAIWMLGMHYVDLYWLIMPTLHEHGPGFHWLDLTTLATTVGFFFAAWSWRMSKVALVPVQDPLLPDSLEFQNV